MKADFQSHAFFSPIDFESLRTVIVPVKAMKREDSWTDLMEDGNIVHSGELKLDNQAMRTFVLFADGNIHFYKDKILFQGSI